jgi:hypothetical protein
LSLLVLAGLLGACRVSSTSRAASAGEVVSVSNTAVTAPLEQLRDIWFGAPAVWDPPSTATFDVRYFAVHGRTQHELIVSLDTDNLCKIYSCLPDPGQPGTSSAWALEGMDPVPDIICYSPRTATFQFRQFILLPRWTPPRATVAIRLVEAWNALLHVLYVHEATHAAIAVRDLQALTDQAHHLATCAAFGAFWSNPHLYDQLDADQNAFHAQLRADCRPEIGCVPYGWMGW